MRIAIWGLDSGVCGVGHEVHDVYCAIGGAARISSFFVHVDNL